MTSIYLVEDEIHALRVLQQKIIDLESDYEIVGTADNGITALEEIALLHPDIVLTDIRMPDMDGLTLIENLKTAGNPPLSIIVSGFQDFEYAKQAVKLGASDYLLKPVNQSELAASLLRCRELLKKKRKNILSFLIGDEKFSFEAASESDCLTIIYMIFANPLSNMESLLHPNVPYLANEETERFLRNHHTCQSLRCYDGFFSNEKILLLSDNEENSTSLKNDLTDFAGFLENQTGISLTIYYTTAPGRSLASSIRKSRSCAIKNTVLGNTIVSNTIPGTQMPAPNLFSDTELYAALLNQGQFQQLHTAILEKFSSWSKLRRNYPAVRDDMIFILDSLKRNFNTEKSVSFTSIYLLENILSFSSDIEDCAQNFYHLILEIFSEKPTSENKPAEDLVDSLIQYFNSHLSSNITLQDLEDKTGFSKVYICRIFKKEKNTTPIDYFTRLKIDRAATLLTNFPYLSLREISDSLGFNDVYYFSKVFKRIYGSTPSELRKQSS